MVTSTVVGGVERGSAPTAPPQSWLSSRLVHVRQLEYGSRFINKGATSMRWSRSSRPSTVHVHSFLGRAAAQQPTLEFKAKQKNGASARVRTMDLYITNVMLLPTELQKRYLHADDFIIIKCKNIQPHDWTHPLGNPGSRTCLQAQHSRGKNVGGTLTLLLPTCRCSCRIATLSNTTIMIRRIPTNTCAAFVNMLSIASGMPTSKSRELPGAPVNGRLTILATTDATI